MGFFFVQNQKTDKNLEGLDPQFLRRHGCNVCPLDKVDCLSPKMDPSGSKNPTILIVGERPTKLEDQKGKPFIGRYINLVMDYVPSDLKKSIRFTNALNCKTSNKISTVELTCCYSRLVKDVEETKPKVIFGFGHAPLFQIVNPDSKHRLISLMSGRRFPVQIGKHVCWYYAFDHPLDIVQDKYYGKRIEDGSYGSQNEFALSCDLKRAFKQLDKLTEPVVHSVEEASAGIEFVDDINRAAELLNAAANAKVSGVDTETNCLRPYETNAKILTLGISTRDNTFSIPVDHPEATWSPLERKQLDVLIKKFLYESTCKKVVHHLPFELEWFGVKYGTGCFYSSRWEDTESQAFLLDARRGALSLDFLCFQYFGLRLKDISGLDRENLEKSSLNRVLKYQGIDARYHRLLYLVQSKRIKEEKLQQLYRNQVRRIPALVLTTMQGIPVDQSVVVKLRKKYEGYSKKAIDEIDKEEAVHKFEKLKGKSFNPGSPHDVNFLLKSILKVEIESTSKGELSHIEHPIAAKIVKYREAQKVLSTYISPIDVTSNENYIMPDGMVHPIFSTCIVVSNRTSSDSINAQNYPKRDEQRKEVRSQIRHKDQTMKIVSFDYAGIQARNVAMESRDKALVEAYWHNYDIHTTWMENINKAVPKWIPKDKVKDKVALKQFRYLAKNKFVFPTFFGAHPFSISESLNIPKNACEDLQNEFFEQFPGIKKWHVGLDKFYYQYGYVTGLSGHICRAPLSNNQRINLPIQGDEAFIVIDALCRLSEMEDLRYQPMLEVHDDLTFCWPKSEIEKRAEVVVKTLINVPFEWANIVPTEVEMSVGDDWENVKEVGKFANNKWNGIIQLPKSSV